MAEPGLWAGSTLLRPPVLPALDTGQFFALLTEHPTVTDADLYLVSRPDGRLAMPVPLLERYVRAQGPLDVMIRRALRPKLSISPLQ